MMFWPWGHMIYFSKHNVFLCNLYYTQRNRILEIILHQKVSDKIAYAVILAETTFLLGIPRHTFAIYLEANGSCKVCKPQMHKIVQFILFYGLKHFGMVSIMPIPYFHDFRIIKFFMSCIKFAKEIMVHFRFVLNLLNLNDISFFWFKIMPTFLNKINNQLLIYG